MCYLYNCQNPQVRLIDGIIDFVVKNRGKNEIDINNDPNDDDKNLIIKLFDLTEIA